MQCTLRLVGRVSPRTACRVPSRRLPRTRPLRTFYTSQPYNNNSPDDPHNPVNPLNDNNSNIKTDEAINDPKEHNSRHDVQSVSEATDSAANGKESQKKELGPYGSAHRRALRNRKSREKSLPPSIGLPPWFRERNLELSGDSSQASELRSPDVTVIQSTKGEEEDQKIITPGGGDDASGIGPEIDPSSSSSSTEPDPKPESRYDINTELWEELHAAIRAGFTRPNRRYLSSPAVAKPHLVLQYPGEGGILFLDAVVKSLARDLEASTITLDAQDISELYEQQRRDTDPPSAPMSLLGYEVYQSTKRASQKEAEEESEEKFDEEEVDEEAESTSSGKGRPESTGLSPSSVLQSLFGGKGTLGFARVVVPQGRERKEDIDSSANFRSMRLVQDLLEVSLGKAPEPKEGAEKAEAESSIGKDTAPLIIQIRDYKDILASSGGATFLNYLHEAVRSRRAQGYRVVIAGTVAEDATQRGSEKTFPKLVARDYDDRMSSIIVTPSVTPKRSEKLFSEDAKRRISQINIRHLRTMLQSRLHESTASNPEVLRVLDDLSQTFDESLVTDCGLNVWYWPFDLVHRVSTLALGSIKDDETLGAEHIRRSIEIASKSDQTKFDWIGDRHSRNKSARGGNEKDIKKKLRGKCNTHEEKLLNGVVDAESIKTTFSDVHVPPDTIDALKTLTSLSLVRPEAFTYGVLATDKIPGLLLYGPPGTGKTLLAKAVARESGATVLEVSGSDVYEMYVGEGEKNVKAIFTLARKLSPCVVFIDEADAIFCSRTGSNNRSSHRELINQFLREWDGMNSLSAFIMIATNRPFDLDDAVLRRLPRRLLVDLPDEKDRLSILEIHLKEENLDPSVDLADLAHRTPFYSGSDLKNLSVAAALACVREENDMAAEHKGSEPYVYPERRTLYPRHFEKATNEISASISEDMSSLTAIKKFDDKYGDRKGRRKKAGGFGFKSPGAGDTTVETGRVRD